MNKMFCSYGGRANMLDKGDRLVMLPAVFTSHTIVPTSHNATRRLCIFPNNLKHSTSYYLTQSVEAM